MPIETPVQMETPTPDSPSSDWHLINRYPELDPSFGERVIEVEVPTDRTLTAEQAFDLSQRLARHATVLNLDTPAGP